MKLTVISHLFSQLKWKRKSNNERWNKIGTDQVTCLHILFLWRWPIFKWSLGLDNWLHMILYIVRAINSKGGG
jgi:hypothetical protein